MKSPRALGLVLLAGLPLVFSGCVYNNVSPAEVARLHTVFVSQEANNDAVYVMFFSTEPVKNTGAIASYCNTLKDALRQDGYVVTDDRAKADCIIRVQSPSLFGGGGSGSAIAIEPHAGLVAFLPTLTVEIRVNLQLTLEEAGTGIVLASSMENMHHLAIDERYHSVINPSWEKLTQDQQQEVLASLTDGFAGNATKALNDLKLLVLRSVPVAPPPNPAPAGAKS